VPNVFHVPDYLILPFGRAVKSDLQKIGLSAVSADGLYFSTEVPVICIQKSKRKPICLADFSEHFPSYTDGLRDEKEGRIKDEEPILKHIHRTLKDNDPDMTPYEELFLDLYFGVLRLLLAL
jgi:hypothetical protein